MLENYRKMDTFVMWMSELVCDGLYSDRHVPTRAMLEEVLRLYKMATCKGMVIGGRGSDGSTTACHIFHPGDTQPDGLYSDYPMKITAHAMTGLKDGRVIATGGTHDGVIADKCYIFTYKQGRWAETGRMHTPRYFHSVVTLEDGRVMAAGGAGTNGLRYTTFASIEFFDPVDEKWTVSMTHLPTRLVHHCAVVLCDGTVLFIGGMYHTGQENLTTAACYAYDYRTDSFEERDRMHFMRQWHAACLLADGRVLVTGGTGHLYISGEKNVPSRITCELYDPATNIWTRGRDMNYGWSLHQCIPTPTGAIIFGREIGRLISETYSLATGEWTMGYTLHKLLKLEAAASCSFF